MKVHQTISPRNSYTPAKPTLDRFNPFLRRCIHRRRYFPERRPKHHLRRREEE